jgi:hypothetical protein
VKICNLFVFIFECSYPFLLDFVLKCVVFVTVQIMRVEKNLCSKACCVFLTVQIIRVAKTCVLKRVVCLLQTRTGPGFGARGKPADVAR